MREKVVDDLEEWAKLNKLSKRKKKEKIKENSKQRIKKLKGGRGKGAKNEC